MTEKQSIWTDRCLVSAASLEQHLDDVHVVDVRWSIERGAHHDDFFREHIAGAVFADLDADLSGPPGPSGRHPLPTPDDFARSRTRLALTGEKPIVVYDDRSGAIAARLWWMLDSLGLDCVVLNGGFQDWSGPVGSGAVQAELPDQVSAVPWPVERYIEVDEIEPAIGNGAVVLDARSAERFRGEPNPIDSRPGHIPGSLSHPWTDNLADGGLMRSPEELATELGQLGVTQQRGLVASCGSGVTACHTLLASRIAGGPIGRLYVGSWSEWSAGAGRPVEVDR